MKRKRLKISLSIIWMATMLLSIGTFFFLFEDYVPTILAYYQMKPLHFNWSEEFGGNPNHSSFHYQLESGNYQLKFFRFENGELMESGFVMERFEADEETEIYISSQVIADRIIWTLNITSHEIISLFITTYSDDRTASMGAGGVDETLIMQAGEPAVLFYVANWAYRDFIPVSLSFLNHGHMYSEEGFEMFEELYILTITSY